MEVKQIAIGKLKPNPDNPRTIRDSKFNSLVESIKSFPEMLKLRPIVVDENMTVLGGNMRLKACKKAGLKKVYYMLAKDLSEDQKKEFIIKDNVGFGEWNWTDLKNEWNEKELEIWGLDPWTAPEVKMEANSYTKKIESPIYEPKQDKPDLKEIYDLTVYNKLVKDIDSQDINEDEKTFLKFAAQRHIVFNYEKAADYYARSEKITQKLMEDSALVIIDFDKAIELGFVKLSESVINQYKQENDEE